MLLTGGEGKLFASRPAVGEGCEIWNDCGIVAEDLGRYAWKLL
jgi:hypothetical protein